MTDVASAAGGVWRLLNRRVEIPFWYFAVVLLLAANHPPWYAWLALAIVYGIWLVARD